MSTPENAANVSAESSPATEGDGTMDPAAAAGTEATIPMQARKGRASYLGPRSIGHQDPGATSSTILFAALAKVTAS